MFRSEHFSFYNQAFARVLLGASLVGGAATLGIVEVGGAAIQQHNEQQAAAANLKSGKQLLDHLLEPAPVQAAPAAPEAGANYHINTAAETIAIMGTLAAGGALLWSGHTRIAHGPALRPSQSVQRRERRSQALQRHQGARP